MCVDRLLRLVVLAAFILAATSTLEYRVGPALASGTPCDNVTGNPGPPVDPPEPEVSGTVVDSGSSDPIEGASIKLYACFGTTAVAVDTQTTDSSGQYVFTELSTLRWYYVEASMTGPLAGMTPSSGTSNPSALLAISDDPTVANLSFE